MTATDREPARARAERAGRRAEAMAVALLRLKGYRICARRYRSPAGEIDIVARRGRALAFVEVKTRARIDDAALSVTPHQVRRIVTAARFWLSRNPADARLDCRFDMVLVCPYRWPRHVENAFDGGPW